MNLTKGSSLAMTETGTTVLLDANGEPVELKGPEVFTDQIAYLNSIHSRFLSHGLPVESGLVDHLRAGHVIDSEDEEDIRAQTSMKDKARKCWTLLARVTAEKFASVCVPALELSCRLVVEGKEFRWDPCRRVDVDKCLHHVLKKMLPVRKFADLFPGIEGCSPEEYGIMLGGKDRDNSCWELAFSLCRRNKGKVDFFREALIKIGVPVPEDLKALLATGIPCTCRGEKRREDVRQTAYTYKKRCVSLSHSSLAKSLNALQEGEEEEKGLDCFESLEQKGYWLKQLEKMNTTIIKVCNIKIDFYKVTGIQTELLFAMSQLTTTGGGSTSGEVVLQNRGMGLQFYIVQHRQNLKDYEAAARVVKETDSVNLDAKIPDKFKSAFVDRREILVRELNDVKGFYCKSIDVFKQLELVGYNQLKSVKNARGEEGCGYESRAVSVGESFNLTGQWNVGSQVDNLNDESGIRNTHLEVLAFAKGDSESEFDKQDQTTVFESRSDLADRATNNADNNDNFETEVEDSDRATDTENDNDHDTVFYESDAEQAHDMRPNDDESEDNGSDCELDDEDANIL